jgi:hypothetical protein
MITRFVSRYDSMESIVVVSGNNNQATSRVRRHRANAGRIRVEVEVPTAEDAYEVRRFAQARRRIADGAAVHEATAKPAAKAGEGPDALLADLEDARRDIAIQFSQALRRAVDPDMLARGRRVALNFADAVAQRIKDGTLRDEAGAG